MPKIPKPAQMTFTAAELADFFSVTTKTVAEWAKNGMPRESHGVYHLKRCFDWWLENINKDEDDETLTAAKRKYWTAKAEKEHVSTQQLKKELIPRAQLVTDRVSRCLDMRQSLLALSARLESVLEMKPRPVIRATIDAEIRKMLEAFSAPSELWPAKETPKPEKKAAKKKANRTTKGKKK